jgi:hypothetical protein
LLGDFNGFSAFGELEAHTLKEVFYFCIREASVSGSELPSQSTSSS